MPLRTVEEFRAGLRDAREVYVRGTRVPDVTEHADLAVAISHAANVFELAADPGTRELFTFELDGDVASRYFEPLTSVEAIERRSRLIEEHTRRGRASLNLTKAVGTDALAGLTSVSAAIDRSEGSEYAARVEAFRSACAHADRTIVLAQTDVKGDRSLAPHEQEDPDLHVRIVERRADGIVVQGAKAHTTMAPVADELIVLPTRAMGEADADYAVAFAIPIATDGLRMICGPLPDSSASTFDRPIASRNVEIESLTVFDRVFVPWERVFMAGEWRFAVSLALTFATYHRFTAIAYKQPAAELLLGCAVLAAELNGTSGASHVREKIARLVSYREQLHACVREAARSAQPVEGGLLLPKPSTRTSGSSTSRATTTGSFRSCRTSPAALPSRRRGRRISRARTPVTGCASTSRERAAQTRSCGCVCSTHSRPHRVGLRRLQPRRHPARGGVAPSTAAADAA